jgi:hypothetical protein
MLHILTLSILFFETAGAKKRIKRNAEKVSPVATGDEGAALDPRAFEKARAKLFESGGVQGWRLCKTLKSPSDNVRGAIMI